MNLQISVKKLREDAVLPVYGTQSAAGCDLHLACDAPVVIAPGETVLLHTGIAMAIPEGYGGFVFARSGLATKQGLRPANAVGVVDEDYRGEIMVALYNDSSEVRTVNEGDRIAQLIILPYITPPLEVVDDLDDTDRGVGGFGSTGA